VPLEHRQEQLLIGGEIRIQRAHGEPGLLGDRVHRRPGVAIAGEHPHRGGDQRLASALAALLPGQPGGNSSLVACMRKTSGLRDYAAAFPQPGNRDDNQDRR
jgi:hypothetical protein